MFSNRQAFVFAAFTFALAFACPVIGHAEPKPAAVNANIVNGPSNAVPVVIQGPAAQEPISFRDGYQVPGGKRLLIDDVSVAQMHFGRDTDAFEFFFLLREICSELGLGFEQLIDIFFQADQISVNGRRFGHHVQQGYGRA